MRYIKAFLLLAAVLGGIASTAAHLLSWMCAAGNLLLLSIRPLLALMLVVGVVAAAICMSHQAGRGRSNSRAGQPALSGCPRWMRIALRILGIYALLSVPITFGVCLFVPHGHEDASNVSQMRLFTAVAMLLFWTASGVFYSSFRGRRQSGQPE